MSEEQDGVNLWGLIFALFGALMIVAAVACWAVFS
jgi:hypothetical protein